MDKVRQVRMKEEEHLEGWVLECIVYHRIGDCARVAARQLVRCEGRGREFRVVNDAACKTKEIISPVQYRIVEGHAVRIGTALGTRQSVASEGLLQLVLHLFEGIDT